MNAVTAESSRPVQSAPPRADNVPRGTILCVDDERNILNALNRLLRRAGHTILTAESGAEGLELLAAHDVDIVISDMRMPQMNGDELLRHVAERSPDTVRILLTGFSDLESTIKAVNDGKIYRYISKPWDDEELRTCIAEVLKLKLLERERAEMAALIEQQNAELKQLNEKLEEKVEARTQQLRDAYQETISVFSQMIELRENSATGHGRRIARLARETARSIGLRSREVQDVYFAALLHDIGKLGMDSELLAKPENRLSESERETLRKHVLIGPGLLVSVPLLEGACGIIRSHHERYDGSGYPDGLAGQDIPLGARIVGALNDFDGLVTGTLTGARHSRLQALSYLEVRAGSHYDPTVVRAIKAVVKRDKEKEETTSDLTLTTDLLAPGMVLLRDVRTETGMIVLAAGTELNDALLAKLRQFESDLEDKLELHVRVTNERR
ncbi:MAG: HD domain-containing phosphohydrolase [Gammaproteobacteria bacterium]